MTTTTDTGLERLQAQGTEDYQRMARVLDRVACERLRQRNLLAAGTILDDCASPATGHYTALAVAGEEFGGIAKATNQVDELMRRSPVTKNLGGRLARRLGHLQEEWIQLAAVCVARAEALEPRAESGVAA